MAPPESDPRQWLAWAAGDLAVAQRVLADSELPDWAAGFHLQQAAEKALKAVLLSHGCPPPRVHDLALLADSAAARAPALVGWAERLLTLSDFAVGQRYPGAPDPGIDLARAADDVREPLAAAEQVCGPR